MNIKFLLLILLLSSSVHSADSFYQAKKQLIHLYKQSPMNSFYCGCKFIYQGKKLIPDLVYCGYKVRKQSIRANRIEWEHVVPASDLTRQFGCSSRKQCKKTSKPFNKASGDLHNLVPAIGEVNGDRSNYRFSDWSGKSTQYGACDVLVDFKSKQVQPPEQSKGFIGRAYLYMRDMYHLKMSKGQEKLMTAWSKKDVQEWECQRNVLIEEAQGNKNSYITNQCRVK